MAGHVHHRPTVVGPEVGRAEVLDLMQARTLHQIPVVDRRGRLLGLHLLHEILGSVERPNWAVIMAGGRGTRLGSITDSVPKPMVRVAGRPILERLVLHLIGFGFKRIFLGVGYLGEQIERHFGDGTRLGCSIGYLRDGSQALGTGGALSLLPSRPKDPLVVLNGDLVTQVNLDRMMDFHRRGRCAATMGVRRYFHQVPFGAVDAANGRVRGFEEKPAVQKLVNAGVYLLEPKVVARVPRKPFPITNLFEQCLARREVVGAFEIEEDWIDVGQREQLRQAQQGTS